MLRRRIIRSSALLVSSMASLVPHGSVKAEDGKLSKQLRQSVLASPSLGANMTSAADEPVKEPGERFPWRNNIVTTTFWVGEEVAKNNPVPNDKSSWDMKWAQNFGGTDDPDPNNRANYLPAKFTPRQNPFYIALPYNDIMKGGHKPEASQVIPWFKDAFRGNGKTVLKGRWIAIRYKGKVAYAQWEDCGPFRTDHWQYVFGNERPKANLNKGAGLDVSPAVRDFLGMKSSDVTDWKFVDFDEVPTGPWAELGDNNTFVINKRAEETRVANAQQAGVPAPGTPGASGPLASTNPPQE